MQTNKGLLMRHSNLRINILRPTDGQTKLKPTDGQTKLIRVVEKNLSN